MTALVNIDALTPTELVDLQERIEDRLAHDTVLGRESEDSLLDLAETRERARRKAEVFNAALYVEINDRDVHRQAGYCSTYALYQQGLRLGTGETRRRKNTAAAIGRLTSMTGDPLEPHLEATEAAVAEGVIGREHVAVIAQVVDKIPDRVDPEKRAAAETDLAEAARHLAPEDLTVMGNRILGYLDPDGQLTDDKDRQRQRTFVVMPQNQQLMAKVRAQLTPELQASLGVMLEQWAQPGMNNPADPDSPHGAADQPGLDPAVLAAAAERDDRSIGQRQHDALQAVLNHANAGSGQASGRIASQIVITVTDEDLQRQSGVAYTATGTRLPVTDLVKFAADTIPYLAVFSKAKGQVLYLGRGSRFASKAQRLALFARDRGCTAPGCTVPFSRTQIHHMPDWQDGGPTDVDHLGGACGKHNRWAGKNRGQWQTTVIAEGFHAGRVGWKPVGRDGPWTVNPIFHPDKLAPGSPPPPVNHRMNAPTTSDDGTLLEPAQPDSDEQAGSSQPGPIKQSGPIEFATREDEALYFLMYGYPESPHDESDWPAA
ncbi:MAG: DUF222 domain-containing protein [Gordonia sp. (in: high G+C Gram-positive bacteria)]